MISIIAPIYNYYPIIIPSLILQTYKNWELILIHDGPDNINLQNIIEHYNDDRINLIYTTKRYNDWGHSLREIGLDLISGEFVIQTNADNYYVPKALEYFMIPFKQKPSLVGVICDMVHNHFLYNIRRSKFVWSYIDCGAFVCRSEVAKKVGWKSKRFDADWDTIKEIREQYGNDRFIKIAKPLFIHN